MAKKPTHGLCDQVIHITGDYLGPAAERFVARQVEHHLHKHPRELKKKDLQQLIVWIDLAMNILEDDKAVVEEYVSRLQRLVGEQLDEA